ncbi:MAG: gliding motility-associated C-terminal domain-containing protein [Bacteroidales bacterium]|jgi:gliding motility-associated-like protein|nr:gliding motility-associated C-terminal domain-containing protein [Bacteroidales bacterium]
MKTLRLTTMMMLIGAMGIWGAKSQTCPNIDFTYGNFTNWQCYAGNCAGGTNIEATTAPIPAQHSIINAAAELAAGTLPDEQCPGILKVMQGKNYSCKLGNSAVGAQTEGIEYTLTVDSNSSLLMLSFAWVLQKAGHDESAQPKFTMDVKDAATGQNIATLPCNHVIFTAEYLPVGLGLECDNGDFQGLNWVTVAFSLEALVGQTIKIRFTTLDCTQSGHYGYAYVICECRPMRIELMYCEGQTAARMQAPDGFGSYTWSRSSDPSWHLYTRQITVPNPWDGETFSCVMTSIMSASCGATIQTEIKKTSIDASFFWAKPGETDDPMLINKYDTCSRTASFVDLSRVFNSEKESVEWRIHGLPLEIGSSSDSIFTVQFPDPDTPTTYLVRLQVTAENGCADTSDALSTNYIRIYPSPQVKIDGPDQLCDGNVDTLWGKEKRTKIVRYQWHFAAGVQATIINDSTLRIEGPGTYILEAENEFGCIIFDTLVVSPLKPVMTKEIHHVNCHGGRDGWFRNSSISGGATPYQFANWILPGFAYDGTDSISLPASSGLTIMRLPAGKYYFYGMDAGGCEIYDTIEIFQPDSLQPRIQFDSTTCGMDNGKMRFYATGGTTPYKFVTYAGDTVSTGTQLNNLSDIGYHTIIIDANYYSALTPGAGQDPDVNKKGCIAESYDTIHRVPVPYITVDSVCEERCADSNGYIGISVHEQRPPLEYTWSHSTDTNYYTRLTRVARNLGTGTYTVHVVDSNGCVMDTTIYVPEFKPLSLTAALTPETCERRDGRIIVFVRSDAPNTLSFGWDGLEPPTMVPFDSIKANLKGDSLYTLTVKDTFCTLDTSFLVTYVPGPEADFTTATYTVPTSTPFALTEISKGSIVQGDWDFGDGNTGQTDGTSRIIYHNYPEKGEYTVFLLVTDKNGCTDTISKLIKTYEEMKVYIPNSFTPNGDGLNDTWKPIMTEYIDENYTLTIFDRWGQAIFVTHDPLQAWDGTVDGKFVQSNTTYTYKVTIRDFTNQDYEYTGYVTVIR